MRIALCILACSLALAANAADVAPKVTVTGSATVAVLPKNLEVVLTFKQKGTDVKAALAALKTARDTALEKLVPLGTKAADARDETPFVPDKASANPMAAMQAMQNGGRLKHTPKTEGTAPEVEMQQVVHMPFPLKGSDALAVTVEAETLKTAVLAAKVQPEAADDEGAGEEGANSMRNIYGAIKKTGPLLFEFSAPKTADVEKQAYAEALRDAAEKARNIAAAAGKQGAELLSISTATDTLGGLAEMQIKMMEQMSGKSNVGERRPDFINGDAPALSIQVTVTVEYQLK